MHSRSTLNIPVNKPALQELHGAYGATQLKFDATHRMPSNLVCNGDGSQVVKISHSFETGSTSAKTLRSSLPKQAFSKMRSFDLAKNVIQEPYFLVGAEVVSTTSTLRVPVGVEFLSTDTDDSTTTTYPKLLNGIFNSTTKGSYSFDVTPGTIQPRRIFGLSGIQAHFLDEQGWAYHNWSGINDPEVRKQLTYVPNRGVCDVPYRSHLGAIIAMFMDQFPEFHDNCVRNTTGDNSDFFNVSPENVEFAIAQSREELVCLPTFNENIQIQLVRLDGKSFDGASSDAKKQVRVTISYTFVLQELLNRTA